LHKDRQTDRQTDEWTDRVIPIYPGTPLFAGFTNLSVQMYLHSTYIVQVHP